MPISYSSSALTGTEPSYTVAEKESLAVVWSILMLQPYQYRTKFTLGTDHESKRWIVGLAEASGQLARWTFTLSEFENEV